MGDFFAEFFSDPANGDRASVVMAIVALFFMAAGVI